MRKFIGDERAKSSIHRLFCEGEDDIALEYLIQTRKDGFKQMINPFVTESFLETVYKSYMQSIYGVNIVTMANIWKVQSIFMDKYYPMLMKYLQYSGANIEYYEFVPNSIALQYMSTLPQEKLYLQQASWNPYSKWDKMYVDDKDANLISPFNIFVHAKIIFIDPPRSFFQFAIPDLQRREILEKRADAEKSNIKLLYSLLPNDNFNKILNLIDMVHRFM